MKRSLFVPLYSVYICKNANMPISIRKRLLFVSLRSVYMCKNHIRFDKFLNDNIFFSSTKSHYSASGVN